MLHFHVGVGQIFLLDSNNANCRYNYILLPDNSPSRHRILNQCWFNVGCLTSWPWVVGRGHTVLTYMANPRKVLCYLCLDRYICIIFTNFNSRLKNKLLLRRNPRCSELRSATKNNRYQTQSLIRLQFSPGTNWITEELSRKNMTKEIAFLFLS